MDAQNVPEELVELLYDALSICDGHEEAREALAAVLPAHEAMVRAKVAEEIEAECIDPEWPNDDISVNGARAAAIARGGQ
jgi:hypothetical protein